MTNKIYLISEGQNVREVSREHSDIKNNKKSNLVCRGLDKAGTEIFLLDKDRDIAKSTVLGLYKDRFKREKKLKLVNAVLMICLLLSLIIGLTKKPEIIYRDIPQQTTNQIIPIKQTSELSSNDINNITINKELNQFHEELKVDYNNLDQQYKMSQEIIENLQSDNDDLRKTIASIQKDFETQIKQKELEIEGKYKGSELEIYKSIENAYYSQKQSEYKKVWYAENMEEIKKQCKAYFTNSEKQGKESKL